MKLGLLILASIICIVTAEDCPEGYKPYDATSLTNQTIEWTSCPVESEPTLECATIEVPLDWTDSSHGTLQLPVARVPANASTAVGKSIFLNFGGPGAPGIAGLIGQGTDLMMFVRDKMYRSILLTLSVTLVVFTTLLHSTPGARD